MPKYPLNKKKDTESKGQLLALVHNNIRAWFKGNWKVTPWVMTVWYGATCLWKKIAPTWPHGNGGRGMVLDYWGMGDSSVNRKVCNIRIAKIPRAHLLIAILRDFATSIFGHGRCILRLKTSFRRKVEVCLFDQNFCSADATQTCSLMTQKRESVTWRPNARTNVPIWITPILWSKDLSCSNFIIDQCLICICQN